VQSTGDGVEDRLGDAGKVAALQSGVVLDRHVGEHGHLGAAQSGDAAVRAAHDACLLGCDLGPAGGEELAHLVLGVHELDATPDRSGLGCPDRTPQGRNSLAAPAGH
jgi:hypothetical protein